MRVSVGLPASATIQTIAGTLTIEQFALLCEEDPGFEVPLFSWDGVRITVGLGRRCRAVGEEQLYAVTLDDGAELVVGSSTTFMPREGSDELRPMELVPGTSLLPLYLGEDVQGYPTFKNVGVRWQMGPKIDRGAHRKVARMVGEWKTGAPLRLGTYVEHIDKDRKNCHPDNLRIVHRPAKARRSRNYNLIEAAREAAALVREFGVVRPKRRRPNNHAVCDVRPMELDQVFGFEVDPGDVFVMGGVFLRQNLC